MSTVRRSLLLVLALGAVLIALVGLVGSISALSSTRAVNDLVDELRPAAHAASDLRQDVLTAGAAVRAFAIAGDTAELAKYTDAVDRMDADGEALQDYAASRPELREQLDQAQVAFEAWVSGYADPRIAKGGGPGTFDRDLYVEGAALFTTADNAMEAVHAAVERDYSRVRDRTNDRLNATLALISASALIGVLMLAVLGRWLTQSIQRPLDALTDTVGRLRDGDHEARAPVSGPREVRQVADALNDLADENHRARVIEVQVQRQLREVDSAKSEFVSNVSHELRTPLTIISGYLELLADEVGEWTEDQARMLQVTQRNVMRLRELIEDLLTLNKAEHSGGTTLELVDLREIVDEVVHDMGFAASTSGLALESSRPGRPTIILGDSDQLHRAVLNLVSNAIKFSDAGGVVKVAVEVEDGHARVRVTDQGIGIPQEDLDKLGSRFFRASNAVRSEVAGTGLGLRIVQTIVSNHHGTLALTSQIGKGTEVVATLPLANTRESTAVVAAAAGEQSGAVSG